MASVRSALLYSATSKYSMRLLGLISTMVLARLLTPSEIGTFAIASSIVMLLTEFRMLGAGVYLIREKVLNNDKIRSALGLTVLISWGLGMAIAGSSPWVSKFYQMPEITTLFIILSISFFLAPYISIPTSLLSRDLKYRQIMIIQMSAAIANFISSVLLVIMGYSFYSLAWGRSIASTVQLLAVLWYRPRNIPWRPSFRNMKSVAKVGIYSSTANILKKSQTTAPDLVIGKMGTTSQVGMFSRGMGFVDFLSQSIEMGISPVALPYLSSVRRQGGDVLMAYTKAALLIGSLTWPVLAVASLTSFPAIRLFFGDQWDAAAPIAAILAYWALFRSVHSLSPPLFLTTGKEAWLVAKEAITFIVFILGIILSYRYGLEAVAWSLVFSAIFNMVLTSWVLKYCIQLNIVPFIRAMLPNIVLTAICWAVTCIIDLFVNFDQSDPVFSIAIVALVLPPVWLLTVMVLNHDIYQEIKNLVLKKRRSIIY
ncbi:oligosaccharide flippase family protein [Saccharospirillum salsuginis]|uniref:Lipopolysaccharide biosynthesis protein n=1 Tax=Saccharospirillum salsuginis TaxID=418750 RepID=A0A918K4R8_9GAMM|nr:oligosaccharide flippase family protein [Saccharospirillum salsuginis]GGX49600.1 lipopolysaccharide biosynthesis protein [Saccharospirillum salsuginis]